MIKHLKHNEIDKPLWDDRIAVSTCETIYPYSWYLDTVCPGWEALISPNYRAVMPLTPRKKFGIPYLFQPHFTQQLGVFSRNNLTVAEIKQFLQSIPESYRYIDIALNENNYFKNEILSFTENRNFILSLDRGYDKLIGCFSENTLRNIKKAKKNKIIIRKSDAIVSELIRMFKKGRGASLKHLGNEYYDTLKNVIEKCTEKKQCSVLGAYSKDNKLIAGAVFVFSASRAIFLFSTCIPEALNTGAMHYIIDYFIREHARESLVLDFEGSNNKGIARLYRSFGSEEKHYFNFKRNRLPLPLRWLKK